MTTVSRLLSLPVAVLLFGLSWLLMMRPDIRTGWTEGLFLLLMIGNLVLPTLAQRSANSPVLRMSITQIFKGYRSGLLKAMPWWQSLAALSATAAVVVLTIGRF